MPKKRKKMTIVIHILIILVVAYVLTGLLLYFAQPFILYFPYKKVLSTPADLGLKFEQVTLVTSDNVHISAWYVPAAKSEFTVIYCHGNGGNLMYYLDIVAFLNSLDLNCLAFDYRGYGDSEGKPTEEGTYLDAEAAYNWLVNEKNISPDKIIIFGWSLGAQSPLILRQKSIVPLLFSTGHLQIMPILPKSIFLSAVKLFAKYNYRTIDYIKNISCPVMVIHSRDDEIAPFRFGEKLFETAKEPKKFVETAGQHNDAFAEVSGFTKRPGRTGLNSCGIESDYDYF